MQPWWQRTIGHSAREPCCTAEPVNVFIGSAVGAPANPFAARARRYQTALPTL